MSTSIIYSALPGNLSDRLELASFNHREGYPPIGRVSPDGKSAAVLVIPPEVSEAGARRDGGEIWLIRMDGGEPELVNQRSSILAQWSPDGMSLIAGRSIATEMDAETLVPDRFELIVIDVTEGTEGIIRSDDGNTAVRPLGWAADSLTYYSAIRQTAGWSVDGWDRQNGNWTQVIQLSPDKDYSSISLSPDGSTLLLAENSSGAVTVSLQSLDGSPPRQLAGIESSYGNTAGISAVWNPVQGGLLLFSPATREKPGLVLRMDGVEKAVISAEGSLTESMITHPGLVPLGWSPDGAWLVYRDYQDSSLPLLLQKYGLSGLSPIPSSSTQATLTFFGWTSN